MALELVTEKSLKQSDVAPRQNRLLIPIADVRKHLLPLLSVDERRDANLLCLMTKKRKKYDKRSSGADGGDRRRKPTEVGRKHGGLAARLIAGGREIGVTLTQWDGTLGAVLKGGAGWKTVVAERKLRQGQRVELFAFRRTVAAAVEKPGEAGELCFLLRKKECSRKDGIGTAEPALEARRLTNIDRSDPLDLSISLGPPAYSAPQNAPNSASRSSIAGAAVKWEKKVGEENGLNLELSLQQPGSEHD